MLVIKRKRDISALKPGGSFVIDPFPDPGAEDQEVTPAMLRERDTLFDQVTEHLAEYEAKKENPGKAAEKAAKDRE